MTACSNATHCTVVQLGRACPAGLSGVSGTCPVHCPACTEFTLPVPAYYRACINGLACTDVDVQTPCPFGSSANTVLCIIQCPACTLANPPPPPSPPPSPPPPPPPPPYQVPPAVDADHFPFADPTTWTGGAPNLADLYNTYLTADVIDPLPAGALCTPRSHLDKRSVCLAGACTAIETARGICERMTCRRGAPWAGTCTGGLVPAGEACFAGCLSGDEGTCDGAGGCAGTPQTPEEGYASVGFAQPDPAVNGDCNSVSCAQRSMYFFTYPLTYQPPGFDYSPLVPNQDDIDTRIRTQVIGAEGLSNWTLSLPETGTPCDDHNACTPASICDNGFCKANASKSSWCKQTQYYDCNPLTAACDVPALGGACVAACGSAGNGFSGYVSAPGVCLASPPDDTHCASIPGACRTPMCVGSVSGPVIYVPAGVPIPAAVLLPTLTFSRSCPFLALPDGAACSQARLAGDRCAIAEMCVLGNCTVVQAVNCTATALAEPCNIPALATCDKPTGNCLLVAAPLGTPCDDGNPCTDGDACGAGALCQPGLLRACPTGGNPCITNAYCDRNLGGQCVYVSAPSTTVCATGAPPNGTCPTFGTCLAGGCAVPASVCPAPVAQCRFPVCNISSGQCDALPVPNFVACDDGLRCTQNDVCIDGGCASGALNPCTPPECWEAVGPCSEVGPSADGCTYAPLTNTSCAGDLGVCGSGLCVITCPFTCAHNETYIVANGECVCRCNDGYFGPRCDLHPVLGGTSLAHRIRDAFAWFWRHIRSGLLVFIMAVTVVTIVSAVISLVCCDYLPGRTYLVLRADGKPEAS